MVWITGDDAASYININTPNSEMHSVGNYSDNISSGGSWMLKYNRVQNVVCVRIVGANDFSQVEGPVTAGLFSIPHDLRPSNNRMCKCPLRSGGVDMVGRVEVRTDGNVTLFTPDGGPVTGSCGFVDDTSFFYTLW